MALPLAPGRPWKFVVVCMAVSAPFLAVGLAHAVLVAVAVVCVAHEVGHCWAARRDGQTASIDFTGWMPGARVEGEARRWVVVAGPAASLAVAVAAFALLVVALAALPETMAVPASEALLAVSMAGAADAVLNLLPSAVIASSTVGWFAVSGEALAALAALSVCVLLSVLRPVWLFTDGDRVWRRTHEEVTT